MYYSNISISVCITTPEKFYHSFCLVDINWRFLFQFLKFWPKTFLINSYWGSSKAFNFRCMRFLKSLSGYHNETVKVNPWSRILNKHFGQCPLYTVLYYESLCLSSAVLLHLNHELSHELLILCVGMAFCEWVTIQLTHLRFNHFLSHFISWISKP